MFGRIIKKNQKSTTIFSSGKTKKLDFCSKHNVGDIITVDDKLLTRCKSADLLNNLMNTYCNYNKKIEFIEKIKDYLKKKGYREVITKKLKKGLVKEQNINYIKTNRGYLASSPEVEIKKLLCLGFDKLFELNYVYRDDIEDRFHLKEFLLLEWYRALATPEEINEEFLGLIKHLNNKSTINYMGYDVDLEKLEYKSYAELFMEHLSIDINDADVVKLKKEFNIYGTNDKIEILDAIFSLKIQDKLGLNYPTVVYDFPKERAALAKVESGKAKRFEMYIATVELSNCYLEETDPNKLKKYLEINDEDFIKAMEFGMPPTSGIAVGVDRLFMVINNKSSIQGNVWQNF